MCSGAVVKRADEAPPPSPPKQPGGTDHHRDPDDGPASTGERRMHTASIRVLQRRRSTERELRCGDASMSEPPPSTSAPDRHDLLAVRTIDSRIGALASALELPSAAMIRRDRGDSEGMMGLRAAEEQLPVRAGVGARAAVECVDIWPAIEDVVPIASEDVVGALPAVESVDPAGSVDVVVTSATEDAVVAYAGADEIRASTAPYQLIIGRPVCGGRHADPVPAVRSDDRDRLVPLQVDVFDPVNGVVSKRPGGNPSREVDHQRRLRAETDGGFDGVAIAASVDRVVSRFHREEVASLAAANDVVVAAAVEEDVAAGPADKKVTAAAPVEVIDATFSKESGRYQLARTRYRRTDRRTL